MAGEYGLTEFAVPFNVGGRFSVFSPVGMFPAAMLGMDIDAMMEGCAAMDKRCADADLDSNPAYLRAAVQYLADVKKGKVMSVMLAYANGLYSIADWYRQLWAESLGKRYSLDGEEVFAGQTLKASGPASIRRSSSTGKPNDKCQTLETRLFARLRFPGPWTSIAQLSYLRPHDNHAANPGTSTRSDHQGPSRACLLQSSPGGKGLYMLEVEMPVPAAHM